MAMDDKTGHKREELDITAEAITELLFQQNIYPETTAERLAILAAASGNAIWLASEDSTTLLDEVTIRHDFIHKILLPVFKYRQNNQDIASLYQWTNYHGPFTHRELQLIEATMTLDKNLTFAEQMRPPSQTTDNKTRGEFIKSLLVAITHVAKETGIWSQHGVNICGSAIEGQLDLSYHENIPPLVFSCCSFEKTIRLSYADLTRLQLTGSQCPGIVASGVKVIGPVELDEGFSALGPVDFSSSQLSGELNASGGSFRTIAPPLNEPALSLQCARLENNLTLGDKFNAEGHIDLDGLSCRLNLKLENARLSTLAKSLKDSALTCRNAEIKGSVLIDKNSSIIGSLEFASSVISGNIDLKSSTFQHPINGSTTNTLHLTHCTIGGHFLCSYSALNGRTALEHCTIKGDCSFTAITADNKSGIASSTTFVSLHNQIGGSLSIKESSIKGCTTISFTDVGTSLDLAFTEMENQTEGKNDITLSLDTLTIGSDLNISPEFRSKGPVALKHLEIGGTLSLKGGGFMSDVIIDGVSVKHDLILDQTEDSKTTKTTYGGTLSLLNTTATTLKDNELSWPSSIIQRNFSYRRFSISAPMNAEKRLNWLNRNDRYIPGSYRVAINSLVRAGKRLEANHLAMAMAEKNYWITIKDIISHPNKAGVEPGQLLKNLRFAVLAPFISVFWLIYGGFLNYGYSISRIILTALLLYVAAAALFIKAEQQNLFMPSNPAISLNGIYASCTPERGGSWTKCRIAEIPPFHPLLYTADIFIPVLNLSQKTNWHPRHEELILNMPLPRCFHFDQNCFNIKWTPLTTGAGFLYALIILVTVTGWLSILGLLFVILSKTFLRWRAT